MITGRWGREDWGGDPLFRGKNLQVALGLPIALR